MLFCKQFLIGLMTLLAATLLLATGPVQAAKYFKWVDDNGNVHYGDRVPPEFAPKERKVLSEQGITVDTIERAKTPEEKAEDVLLARIRAEKQQRDAEIAAKDRMLVATFATEEDLLLARDGKIAAIESMIGLTEGRIKRIHEQLEAENRGAAELERSGKPVPDELKLRIAQMQAQIQHNLEYIQSKREEQEHLRLQSEHDLLRFRELRGDDPTATTQEKPAAAADSAPEKQ